MTPTRKIIMFSIMIRLIGLTPIVGETNCSTFYYHQYAQSATWPVFLNPVILILFYVYTAFQYKLTKDVSSTYAPVIYLVAWIYLANFMHNANSKYDWFVYIPT